ncbi:MAG: transketolase [Oscillospiraceae bacterium]|nr:transketolase [Oscillospiraceae bacterium]MBR0451048.1 transketolase [Oscillospiraceae bacterium]MDO5138330.1 transketolase [Oscillospiraceae bacterium]
MDNTLLAKKLEAKALEIRKDVITTCYRSDAAHLGGALSLCDVAVALYYHYLRYDPANYLAPDRDRLVLSKGHSGCLLYNIFADLGIYTFEDIYNGYNKVEGAFGQHPNRLYLPMFEASTGSLGHGLSIAFGMAMALRNDGSDSRVFCITGDGELDEGSNWEALMSAANYELSNLFLIVDRNKLQGCRPTEETVRLESLEAKLRAFNWDVVSFDGNNMEEIIGTFDSLPPRESQKRKKPLAMISNTIKGKGVDFMENNPLYHVAGLNADTYERAMACLNKTEVSR